MRGPPAAVATDQTTFWDGGLCSTLCRLFTIVFPATKLRREIRVLTYGNAWKKVVLGGEAGGGVGWSGGGGENGRVGVIEWDEGEVE